MKIFVFSVLLLSVLFQEIFSSCNKHRVVVDKELETKAEIYSGWDASPSQTPCAHIPKNSCHNDGTHIM